MTGAGLARRVEQAPRIAEAAALLAATRLLLVLSPRVGAGRLIGRAGRPCSSSAAASPNAAKVARAVQRAACWIVGSTCLNQALTGWLMLKRRGIASVVRVGARRESAGGMSMHAWLEVGGQPLIGREEASGFVPLSR